MLLRKSHDNHDSGTVGQGGEVTLPGDVRDRYGMSPETQVRLVETQAGLLLVPLSGEPMSEALAQELAQWQELGRQSWEMFPYEEEAP